MTLYAYADLIAELFDNPLTLDEARLAPQFFTRTRKMPFSSLLRFLLCGGKGSAQAELNRFFQNMGDEIHMTQQALSKARNHMNHTPFQKAFYATVEAEYNARMDAKLMRKYGYKFIAIDGSIIPLPNLPALGEEFGTEKGSPSARASIANDVLNDRIIEAEFEPLSYDERTLALRHIHKLAERMIMSDTVFIFDRGYASADMIKAVLAANAHYIMRVKRKFNVAVDDAPMGSSYVTLDGGIRVRVVKFLLPTGEVETLITDLFDIEAGLFKVIYFMRWPVETKFDIVKCKLELPNFTGFSGNILRQDFWISMLLANAVSVAKSEADEKIKKEREGKGNRYEYQMNVSIAVASMRNRFADAVLCADPVKRRIRINKILEEVSASVVPVRPDRNIPRKSARNVRFHHNKKSNI